MTFSPVKVNPKTEVVKRGDAINLKKGKRHELDLENLPDGRKVVSLSIEPPSISLESKSDYAQLLVTAKLNTGETADLTRKVKWTFDQPIAKVGETGVITSQGKGSGLLTATFGEKVTANAKVVGGRAGQGIFHPDFYPRCETRSFPG